MNIQEIRTAPRSLWQNAYVERVIGSIRRECLDHVIVANEAGLQRVLSDYLAYYLHFRPHLALDKDTPFSRSVAPPSAGRVVATPQVGGLHHRYDRIAAWSANRDPPHSIADGTIVHVGVVALDGPSSARVVIPPGQRWWRVPRRPQMRRGL